MLYALVKVLLTPDGRKNDAMLCFVPELNSWLTGRTS
jgi:hypothetical protein